MQLTIKGRRRLQLQSWSFVLLLLALVALIGVVSERYSGQIDMTATGRHTLSEATTQLLAQMEGPLEITAFTRALNESQLAKQIRELIERYQRLKGDIKLDFVDPDREPELVRQHNITMDGELLIRYGQRQEQLTTLGEQALTNALQRLLRSGEREVVFISGHGERRFDGAANHDLSQWAERLAQKGFLFRAQNLSVELGLSKSVAAVVLASPRTELLPGEVEQLLNYVDQGGNLLWLHDPDDAVTLPQLQQALGVAFNPGTLVDPTGQMLGIDNPAFILVAEYPQHPVTGDLSSLTLFPIAHSLNTALDSQQWQAQPILQSLERSWLESGELQGEIDFNQAEGDLPGPQTLALALTREITAEQESHSEEAEAVIEALPARQQRVVVVADGDFISNAYLGNGANHDLGERLLNWLSYDDAMITIPSRAAPDVNLELSSSALTAISLLFLILIPLGLLGSGGWIWWRRRRA
ncbi:ABC transporter [Ectothiorhodospiraceae bacterium BW-2]|nr:ABC transporter [Ectothiorhodospiraceae bacterium BW-2]